MPEIITIYFCISLGIWCSAIDDCEIYQNLKNNLEND